MLAAPLDQGQHRTLKVRTEQVLAIRGILNGAGWRVYNLFRHTLQRESRRQQ